MALCGITARNDEQAELISSLMDKNVRLTLIDGALGSGKTLIATAFAMHLYLGNERKLKANKIIITRPIGKNILGTLPGDEIQKVFPYLGGFTSAIEVINETQVGAYRAFEHGIRTGLSLFNFDSKQFKMTFAQDYIEDHILVKSLDTVNGFSFKDAVILVDEAQNAPLQDLKKIIGRASENTRVVIMFDTKQKEFKNDQDGCEKLIDAVMNYGDQELIKYHKLTKVERSKLAEFADKL